MLNRSLSWDYGEAHHFKGHLDGIGGTIKCKVYQDVTSSLIVIANAEHFARYANEVCKTEALYLDRTDITEIDVEHTVYIPGTLQVHSIQRVNESTLKFYFNSPYKQPSSLVKTVNYGFPKG